MTTLAEAQAAPAEPAATPPGDAVKPNAAPAVGVVAPTQGAPPRQEATAAAGEPKPAEKVEDQKAVQRIATLSREKREIETRLSGAEKRAALAEADAKALAELRANAPKDPRRVIKELGLTFEQLVDAFAGEPAPAAKDPMAAIEEMRKELAEKDRQAQEAAANREREAIAAQARQAEEDSARNITAQIAADPVRWEVIGRVPGVGAEVTKACIDLLIRAANAGKPIEGEAVNQLVLDVLDGLEAEYVSLGERYRKTAKASANAVQSEGPGERRTLAERQSERQPPKTIDPSAGEGGILQRAQSKGVDNSADAVRARVRAALKASGATILQR